MKTVIAILALIASYHTFKAYASDVEMYEYHEITFDGVYRYPDGTFEFHDVDKENEE
ncbi:MAG: hypothetical protein ACRCUJ_06405 [Phocaeicola sp.]